MSENDVASTNVPATRDEISNMGDLGSAERLSSFNVPGPVSVAT